MNFTPHVASAGALVLSLGCATVLAYAQPSRPMHFAAADKPVVEVQQKSKSCIDQCFTRCALALPGTRGQCQDRCISLCRK
jgi:hypothetical protein